MLETARHDTGKAGVQDLLGKLEVPANNAETLLSPDICPEIYRYPLHDFVYRGFRVELEGFVDLHRSMQFDVSRDLDEGQRLAKIQQIVGGEIQAERIEGIRSLLWEQIHQGPWGNRPRLTLACANAVNSAYSNPLRQEKVGPELYVLAVVPLQQGTDPLISWSQVEPEQRYQEAGLILAPDKSSVMYYLSETSWGDYEGPYTYYEVVRPADLEECVAELVGVPKQEAVSRLVQEGIVLQSDLPTIIQSINRLEGQFVFTTDLTQDKMKQRFDRIAGELQALADRTAPYRGNGELQQAYRKFQYIAEVEWECLPHRYSNFRIKRATAKSFEGLSQVLDAAL